MKTKILILCFFAGLMLSRCTSAENDSSSITSISVSTTAETTEIKETVPEIQKTKYILNISTGKFHCPDCPSVDLMNEENKQTFTGDKESLIEYGYSPCGRCDP